MIEETDEVKYRPWSEIERHNRILEINEKWHAADLPLLNRLDLAASLTVELSAWLFGEQEIRASMARLTEHIVKRRKQLEGED